jgi:hypothetical protein
MKKPFIFLFFLSVSCLHIHAQVNTVLSVQSTPTAVLSEWYAKNSVVTFVVTKTDSVQQQAIFKTDIKLADGTVIGTTDITKATPVTLTKGTRVYYSKDVMPLEIMIFTGRYKNILGQTGKLPAGNYQFCVQLISPASFQPLAVLKCGNFNMVALQLPVLILPAANTSLGKASAQTAITFRWTPLTPLTQNFATYRLQVFEILPGQQPIQALRGNQPLLDVSVKAVTQYIWRPGLSFNATDSLPAKFIWTIQTLDNNGQPVLQTDGNGESRSEPALFYIIPGIPVQNKKEK